jgi:hypothetical protein
MVRSRLVGVYSYGATIAATREYISKRFPGVHPFEGRDYSEGGICLNVEAPEDYSLEACVIEARGFANGYEKAMIRFDGEQGFR